MEADTCRTYITPKLQAAGWETEPHSITEPKDYAEILKLKAAYATNGHTIIEGFERELATFSSPAELWARLRAAEKLTDDTAAQRLLAPLNANQMQELLDAAEPAAFGLQPSAFSPHGP